MKTERMCLFFSKCAAYIIEEKRGKNWRELFCFADCGECEHHKYRRTRKYREDREKALSLVGASPAEILKWP